MVLLEDNNLGGNKEIMKTGNTMHAYVVGLFMLLITLSMTTPAVAQFDDMPLFGVELHGEGLPETNFEKNDATMSYIRGGVSLSVLTLNVDYTIDRYSWGKLDKLPFGNGKDDPWKNLHSLSVGGFYGGGINTKWSYLVGLMGSASFEDSLDSSYLDGALAVGAIYSLSDQWNLVGGAGVMYSNAPELVYGDIFDDPWEVIPIPVLGFQWNQEAESGPSASVIFPLEATISYRTSDGRLSTSTDLLSQESDITYQFNPVIGMTLGASLANESIYQLAKDNMSLPVGEKEGYLTTEKSSVELTANLTFFDSLHFRVGPYYTFDQKLSIRSKKDKELQRLDPDNAFGGKFMFSMAL